MLDRRARALLAALTLPAVSVAALVTAPVAHAAQPVDVKYTFPNYGTFVAPGPGLLDITVVGGSGGNGSTTLDQSRNVLAGAPGGLGESLKLEVSVIGGEAYTAFPGQAGGSAAGYGVNINPRGVVTAGSAGASTAGAVYAGGAGGAGAIGSYGGSGGGGGAASVLINANGTFITASPGGGGGGGSGAAVLPQFAGGAGGAGNAPGAAGVGNPGGAGGTGFVTGAGQTPRDAVQGFVNVDAGGGGGGGGGFQGGVAGEPGDATQQGAFSSPGAAGGGGSGGSPDSTITPVAIGYAPAPGDGYVEFAFTPQQQIAIDHLAVPSGPIVAGQPVTLTDNYTPYVAGLPTPTGTETFYSYDIATGASTAIGQASLVNGAVTFTTTSLPVGTAHLYGSYSGDGVFERSNSIIDDLQIVAAIRTTTITPSPLSFPATTVGVSTSARLTVTNTGNLLWTFTQATASNADYAVTSGTCTTAVAPGGSCTLNVRFTPSITGADNATLTLQSSFGITSVAAAGIGVALKPPVVTAVRPSSGPKAGGSTVTVTGSNFQRVVTVLVGSKPATSFSCTRALCTIVTPSGTGTVNIRVISAAGTSAKVTADRFSYV